MCVGRSAAALMCRGAAREGDVVPLLWWAAGVEGAVVVGKVLEQADEAFGYNAATNVYEDMIKAGVIDPVKVGAGAGGQMGGAADGGWRASSC